MMLSYKVTNGNEKEVGTINTDDFGGTEKVIRKMAQWYGVTLPNLEIGTVATEYGTTIEIHDEEWIWSQ
jgi:hypothetical protein